MTKLLTHATARTAAGKVAGPIALALVLGATVAMGATFALPAGATELQMPAAKSRLLRDRDNVTVIIIDKDDRRPRSTPPVQDRLEPGPSAPASKIRRTDDGIKVYIKRKTGSSHARVKNSGPKVIIVDKNSSGCDGGGVCVIRP